MNIVEDKQWKYMQTEAYAQEKADEAVFLNYALKKI
jgi:hypothetical protein